MAIKANNISGEIIGRVSSEPRKLDGGVGYAVQRWKKAEQGRAVTVVGDYVKTGVGKRSPQFEIKDVRVIGSMDKDGNVKVLDKRYEKRISESHEGEGSGMKQLIERIESLVEAKTRSLPQGMLPFTGDYERRPRLGSVLGGYGKTWERSGKFYAGTDFHKAQDLKRQGRKYPQAAKTLNDKIWEDSGKNLEVIKRINSWIEKNTNYTVGGEKWLRMMARDVDMARGLTVFATPMTVGADLAGGSWNNFSQHQPVEPEVAYGEKFVRTYLVVRAGFDLYLKSYMEGNPSRAGLREISRSERDRAMDSLLGKPMQDAQGTADRIYYFDGKKYSMEPSDFFRMD